MLTLPSLPGIAFPIKRVALWSTLRQTAASGRETRLQLWTYPRWRYELPLEFLRTGAQAEFEALAGFVNAVGGAAQVWRFTDPDDGVAAGQAFGIGDGATRVFQLTRWLGGFVEPVFAPSGSPIIKRGAVTMAEGTNYTLSASGLVTFTSPPARGLALTWTGAFDWICRFDEDEAQFEKLMSGLWSGALKFTTVKP